MNLLNKREKKVVAEPVEAQVDSGIKGRIATLVAGRGPETIENSMKKVASELDKLSKLNNRTKAMAYFDGIARLTNGRLKEIKEFKEKGGKVVGTLCNFVPLEIVDAAGALPIGLGCGYHSPVGLGEGFLGDPNLCPMCKTVAGCTMIEEFPLFDLCDAIIAPTPCDAKLKFTDAFRDHLPIITMNIPRVKTGESVRRQWVQEILNVKDKMEKLTRNKVDKKRLRASIEKYQRAHRLWRKLLDLRKKDNVLWGRDFLLISWLGYIDDIERWTKNVEALCKELEGMIRKGVRVCRTDAPRVMLAGSPIMWPNWKFPNIIEEAGAIIVSDELCSGTRMFYDMVVVDEWTERAMIDAITDRYLYPCTCPCFTPNLEREENIFNEVETGEVEGVVFHALQGCHLHSIDSSRISIMLKDKNIPVLALRSEYSDGDIGQMKVRVEAFIEMIIANRDELV